MRAKPKRASSFPGLTCRISVIELLKKHFSTQNTRHFRRSLAEHKENLEQMDEESKEMEEAIAKSGAEEQNRLERQKHKEQVMQAENFKKNVSISDPSPSTSSRQLINRCIVQKTDCARGLLQKISRFET